MAFTDPFVLPAGTIIQPVGELPETLRREMQAEEGDYAVSRPNSRTHSKVIDAELAALIREFESPSTIGRAVARFSRGRTEAAEKLLEDALPMIESLIAARLLVNADSPDAAAVEPSLATEETIAGCRVVRCLQTLEDTELYEVRTAEGKAAALKIAREKAPEGARQMFEREALVLGHLDGGVTPALLGKGEVESRPYLLIEWCRGLDANAVSEEFRRRPGAASRAGLLRLGGAILEAYAELHRQGVIHGDIHPRNLLVGAREAVRIIDFGLGRLAAPDAPAAHPSGRGGISFFFEPEFAAAVRTGHWPPPTSFAGEQYAIAALLYLLVTGAHYLNFSLERGEMMRQIAEEPMVAFAERGVEPWPELEEVLGRALSKDPAERFGSMAEFAAAWRSVAVPRSVEAPARAAAPAVEALRKKFLDRVSPGGELWKTAPLPAPSTSVNYGSAGIAFALFRMAALSGDAEMFALADLWSMRALSEMGLEGAFYNEKLELTPKTIGHTSLYHSPAGVFAVQALIARARADAATQQLATAGFVEASKPPTTMIDLALGKGGSLLGAAMLLEAGPAEAAALEAFGGETLGEIWKKLDGYGPIGERGEMTNLGIAHGWAGLLYASLAWCRAARQPLPGALADRLSQLAGCAEPAGRGLQWKWDLAMASERAPYMTGWCNGSAGYVFLFTAAYEALGEESYLELAEGAAWNVWDSPARIDNLCCGIAGQGYALLRLYRATGDALWLQRAGELARAAAALPAPPQAVSPHADSLYKGPLGLIVLQAELEDAAHAAMPMFESEG